MPTTPARCAHRHRYLIRPRLFDTWRLNTWRCTDCQLRAPGPRGGFWWLGWRIRYWWPLSAAWRRACLIMLSIWILVALIMIHPAATHAHVRTWRTCWQHETCQR